MKLLKFNSVRFALFVTIALAFVETAQMNSMSYLVADSVPELVRNAALVVLLYLIKAALVYVRERQKSVAQYYVRRQYNSRIDRYYEELEPSGFGEKAVGERAALYVNDVSRVLNLTLGRLFSMAANGTLIMFILIFLCRIHWSMLLAAVLMGAALILTEKLFDKKLQEYILRSQKESEQFLKRITEVLTGYMTFVENSAFHKFRRRSERISETYARAEADINTFAGILSAALMLVSNLFTVAALALLSWLVIRGEAAAGTLLAVMSLLPALGDALELLFSDRGFYSSGKTLYREKFLPMGMEGIYEKIFTAPFLRLRCETGCYERKNVPENIRRLETKNLKIRYKDKLIPLPDIVLEEGGKYALTGNSGCGKSSLLKVLAGEWNDYDGDVLADGKVLDKNHNLFSDIAYVNQDTFLFEGTLEENIRLDNGAADVEKLLEAVGLQADAGQELLENGKNFSGGQRQRVAIARALAREKKILFMDEATANLDARSSQKIENMVLDSDKTVVLITHKLTDETRGRLDRVIEL